MWPAEMLTWHAYFGQFKVSKKELKTSSKGKKKDMSIEEYNGSAVVGMAGKNCVGIAADSKLGVQLTALANDAERIFKVNNRTLLGLSGLYTDVLTVKQKLETEVALYKLNEEKEIRPSVFCNLLNGFLYSRRFGPYFTSPIVVGLEPDGENPGEWKPFISSSDLIGASSYPKDFVVEGTAQNSLMGAAESYFKPDLGPDELFETLSQTLLSAVDRDCLTGWGGEVHILTPTQHIVRKLKGRHD
eukprot:augustus_masked-scaffold_15-processed-gene-9.40-mRNA-1 protein AED:0.06 eAED:0.06 QI:0/-1/0/1/-1/1/1/0/243